MVLWFTSCLVDSKHKSWEEEPFRFSFWKLSGADDPRPAARCCVGTWNFHRSFAESRCPTLAQEESQGRGLDYNCHVLKSWLSVCHERRKLRLK